MNDHINAPSKINSPLCNKRSLYDVKFIFDALINWPPPPPPPKKKKKNVQNNSVSCLIINTGFRITLIQCQVESKDRLMLTITLKKDSDVEVEILNTYLDL